jgi:hypothetical protein
MLRTTSVGAALFALSLLAACGDDYLETPAPPSPAPVHASLAAKPTPPAPTTRDVDHAAKPRATPPALELAPVAARGALLQRLPKTTLLALRFPKVELLGEAWRRAPLRSLFEAAAGPGGLDRSLAQCEETIAAELPDYAALKRDLFSMQGELVVAVTSFDARALTSRGDGGVPLTVALLFDAGAHADALDGLLQRVRAVVAAKRGQDAVEDVAASPDHWYRRVRIDGGRLELARDGRQFVVQLGPTSETASGDAPLPTRALAESFCATEVVRATPSLGDKTVAETFVNLAPIWTAVELLAPAEAKSVLQACDAPSIAGLSAVTALAEHGFDETARLVAPGGKDLLTQVLTARPLDAALARYVPADAANAALTAFDLAALFDGVQRMLPEETRKQMQAAFAQQKSQGLDLQSDVIANLGPSFGVVGATDLTQLFTRGAGGGATSPLDFTLLVELQDGHRFQRMVDRLAKSTGFAAHVRKLDVDGVSVSSVEATPVPGPDGAPLATVEPTWHVGDHALVLSTSVAAMRRCLEAAHDAENRGPAALKQALAKDGDFVFSVATAQVAPGVPPSTTIGRRTALGLELTTRDGPGAIHGALLGGTVAALPSVVLPMMLSSRIQANEKAAVAALREIGAAQSDVRAKALVDVDGDGHGEFATLGELTGRTALRNGRNALDPPPLASAFAPDAHGFATRGGYLFRVDLPTLPGSRTGAVATDASEQHFVAYAWPLDAGTTGRAAFVIDEKGSVYFTKNEDDHRYSGADHAPQADAAEVRDATARVNGVTSVRRGRDGRVWLELE